MFNSAAINCVPHSPHYGKGWGVGEISKYPTLGMSIKIGTFCSLLVTTIDITVLPWI